MVSCSIKIFRTALIIVISLVLSYLVYNSVYITDFSRHLIHIFPQVNITHSNSSKILDVCPRTPPNLVGDFAFHPFSGNMNDLNPKFTPFDAGGKFRPTSCKALEKLAIIIPYRNRTRQLINFMANVIPMLIRQQLEFTIFVIDQVGNNSFNRGILMNIGFKESLKRDNYTCFIFHDVDLYPIHDFNLYRCETLPRHMAVALQYSGYKLLFQENFGGITAYTKYYFELTNGFSNLYFGWGGEDGDQRNRLFSRNIKYSRYPVVYGRYATPHHKRDNPANKDRFELLANYAKRMYYDGLNSLVYNVQSINYEKLYTHIKIVVDRNKLEKNIEKTKRIVEKEKEKEKLKKKEKEKLKEIEKEKEKLKLKEKSMTKGKN